MVTIGVCMLPDYFGMVVVVLLHHFAKLYWDVKVMVSGDYHILHRLRTSSSLHLH